MAGQPDAPFSLDDLLDDELAQITAPRDADTPATGTTDLEPASPDPAAQADTSEATPEPDTSLAGAPEAAPAGTDPVVAEAAVPPAPAEPAAPAASPEGKPFQFKASGGTHVFPGATELPDGSVVIAKDAQNEFRRVLAHERELRQNFQRTVSQHRRELNDAKTARTAKDVEADRIAKEFAHIASLTPEQQWDYFQDFKAKIPQLELEIQREQIKQEREALERQKAGPEPTPEEQQEQARGTIIGFLNERFREFAKAPEIKQLTKDELRMVYERWQSQPERLVRQATEDDPSGKGGYKTGDWIFDDRFLTDDINFLLKAKEGSRANGAAAINAARNGDTNAAPPVVTGGRLPASPAKPKNKPFDREAFLRGDDDA